jgi:MscS family membrane protein
VLALSVFAGTAAAQEFFDSPLRPPDTSSPRATLQSFLDNVREAYDVLMPAYASYLADPSQFPLESTREAEARAQELLDRAVRTLNLSEIPPALGKKVGLERALLLKEVLDRIPLPPSEAIPDAAAMTGGAGEKAGTEQDAEGGATAQAEVSRWRVPGTEIAIARVEEGPRKGAYLFTPATVARVVGYYERVRGLPYRAGATEGFYEFIISAPGLLPPRWFEWIERLPDWTKALFRGQTVWQWTGLMLALLVAALVPLLVDRWRRHRAGPGVGRTWRRFLVPVSLILVALGVRAFVQGPLNLTGNVLQVVQQGIAVVLFVAGSWAVVSFSGVVAEMIITSPRISDKGLDANLLRLGFRLVGFVIAVLIILTGMAEIGVPVVPIAAGLGVGGLAVALAAQPTLENLIASLTLYFDKPLKVGDFCRYGEDPSTGWLRIGTIEEIGLRSTRLRGIDRTVTTIPNADFAKLQLINLTLRDRMLLKTMIALRYETTPEQLRFVLAKLREMLLGHPKITAEPARVRFVGFGDCSLNVEIFAYGDTKDWNQFLGIQEDVYLRIMDIVKEAGTGFAFPSQTTYFTRDSGLNEERAETAEAEVQAWRSGGTLPFPEFEKEHRERVLNTLAYPPEGAPAPAAMSETPVHTARRWLGLKLRRKKSAE